MSLEYSATDSCTQQTDSDDRTSGGPMSLVDAETLALVGREILSRRVEIACGSNRRDMAFRTITAPFADLLTGILGNFRTGAKDGLCILSGGLITPAGCQRIKKNVTRNHLMMFDHDTGVPVEVIKDKIAALGYFAVIYTTYSHMKPVSEYAESKVTRWLAQKGQTTRQDGSITVEQAVEYLKENTKLDPAILASVSAVEKQMVEGKGVVYRITHAPMPRCRSVLVLKEPFDFARRGTQAQAFAEWEQKYTRVANLIDGTFDSSCTDPSRLMYTPVKAPDAVPGTHEWAVVPGAMVDLEALPDEDDPSAVFRAQGAGAEDAVRLDLKTPNLSEFLRLHGDDFEAAEWMLAMASDDLRGDKGDKLSFACPNEDGHTEPDPTDQAFVVWNASMRPDGHGFHMLCMHDTCKTASHDKRAWYLDQACQKYGVSDAWELRAFCPRWEEEQPAQTKAENAEDALRIEIEELIGKAASFDDVMRAAVKIGQLSPGLVADYLTGLLVERAKPHKLTKKSIEEAVKEAREHAAREKAKDADNSVPIGNAYEVPDDPSRTSVIWSQWDFSDKTRCAIATFNRKNGNKPEVFTRPEGGAFLIKEVKTRKRIELQFQARDDADAWGHHLNHVGIKFKSIKEKRQGHIQEKEVAPPRDVCARMRVDPDVRLPICAQTLTTPVFNAKGALRLTAGYDPELYAYLKPNIECVPPPVAPSEDDVDLALWWLLEAVRDFPFTDNFGADEDLPIRSGEVDEDGFPLPNLMRGRSSRVNFYALVLQPFVRAMINGPCPAFHIDKPAAGTGATKLVNVAALIFEGQEVDTQTLPEKDDELAKSVLAFLRTGGNVLFFDNINHHVDSGVLAGAITAGRYRGRILGLSEQASLDLTCSWVWAGNNVTFSHELMRRNVPIRLDAATPNPEKEPPPGGYKYEDLEGWVRQNRQGLVWACHTLIQNWVAQGRPYGSARLASFEDWAGVMSGILECAGVPEGVFLGNIGPYVGEKDDEAGAYDALVQWIADAPVTSLVRPWRPSDLLEACERDALNNPLIDLGITHPIADNARLSALGKLLKRLDGKTFKLADGRCVKLTRLGKDGNRKRYDLVPVGR